MQMVELPSWLAAEERYEPAGARHRVMQKNVLHLASLLERVRLGGGAHEGGSMVDRALSCVSAPVLGVSWTLTWSRMSAALKMLHLPDEVIFTFDMALKHIEVLGRTAHDLCESVMLRSVGSAPAGFSRTDSLAGIMGMTFIKAMECSRAMDEAMLCRGFAGAYPAPARSGFGWRDAVYAAVVALLAVLCAVL